MSSKLLSSVFFFHEALSIEKHTCAQTNYLLLFYQDIWKNQDKESRAGLERHKGEL